MQRHHGLISNRRVGLLMAFAVACCTPEVHAISLSLGDAEHIALQNDPSLLMVEARREALEEQAVAAGQLPDPMLKMGVGGLPTDTFNLGQEAMTQVLLGVVQQFPRGRTRALRAEQFSKRSEGLGAMRRDTRLQILRSVREHYLEVLKQVRLAEINNEAITVFTDLADITHDYYATGRVQQQDVLRASVELARVQDRGTRISQQEDQARAALAAWIGEPAYRELDSAWPNTMPAWSATEILSALPGHPRLQALQQNVDAAETGVELAREKFKPGFSVDLTYGGRGGRNPDGSSRPDLLSMMVMMDVPLFTGKRQDRLLAASVAESSAAAFQRDDVYRQMRSEVETQAAVLRRERERIELFERVLLPEAEFNADATFEAYQAAVEDLTTLMRARITEYELELDYARLQADMRKTLARLRYLAGEER